MSMSSDWQEQCARMQRSAPSFQVKGTFLCPYAAQATIQAICRGWHPTHDGADEDGTALVCHGS